MRLVLRGGSGAAGGLARSIEAVTSDSGLAVFRASAGREAQTYRLEVLTGGSELLPGRPVITLTVVAAAPTGADVQPLRLDLGREEGPFAVQVAVRDSFGNPVTHEPVELQPQSANMGVAPDTRSTDSLGGRPSLSRRRRCDGPGGSPFACAGNCWARSRPFSPAPSRGRGADS
ncbi:MAG: hypothetical protein E6H01_14625 [Bacillati bacterium ANGP1]|uniref:Invasin domain-containing protein n=1 Tax=Candidatus Segetimicrobium genomatis TaxID=2569760 RepID=A0A537KH38_9BACT|nr:MAG: hypothetical protein E6H01_14625 [Terrabacteria group bacterium ANGP1]